MKIAYLGPVGVFGGVRAIVEHCNGLARRGHQMTMISTDNQPLTWLPLNAEQRPFSDPGSGYDVVVGTAVNTWPMARKIAGDARTVGLLQMAEWLFAPFGSEAYRQLMTDFAEPIDVMAISAWLADLAETVGGRKVYRIRNGIDTKLFYPEKFPDIPPRKAQARILIEGNSVNPAKDIREMSAGAIRTLRYLKGYDLEVYGLSQFPGNFEFDRFWQNPPQIVIRRIYSSSDIFLKASRYEGRPGPDMEAMACGAAVCRAIGTGGDDLRDGENSLVVEYGDFEGYLSNLQRLIDDPDLRARLAANGLDYVRNHYHWEGAIDLVEEALTGAVSQQQGDKTNYDYDLGVYNSMMQTIVEWETPQAVFLAEQLADIVQPRTVLDVGCGPGNYLVPFKPAARVMGVDGAPEAGKCLEKDEFGWVDLRTDWEPFEHYDLALCIEVAEHLPPDRADHLVGLLARAADVIFWSAAQPGQGGTLHFNEQPREWWLGKFRAHGFDLHPRHDALAALIAADPSCQRVQWLIGNSMLLERAR